MQNQISREQFREFIYFLNNDGKHENIVNELRYVLFPKSNQISKSNDPEDQHEETLGNVFDAFSSGSFIFVMVDRTSFVLIQVFLIQVDRLKGPQQPFELFITHFSDKM